MPTPVPDVLDEFVQALSASTTLQRSFLHQARGRVLRHLHRCHPGARSAWLEEAWADTLAALVGGEVRGFVCHEPVDSPAFVEALSRYLAFRVAPHKAADVYRREGRELTGSELETATAADDADAAPEAPLLERLVQQAHAAAPGQGDWTSDAALQRQLVEALHRCIAGLSSTLKPVVQALLAEQPHETTRVHLGLASVGTVKSRLFAAMGELRRCMGVRLPHGGPREGDPPGAACTLPGDPA